MKKLLRQWLGMNEIDARLFAVETAKPKPPTDLQYPDGAVQRRGIWAHVYALMRYLNVRPTEEWVDDQSIMPSEHPKICVLKIVKEPSFKPHKSKVKI